MDWFRSALKYSDLEKELLNEDSDPSIFKRYAQVYPIDNLEVHVVKAPASNVHKLPKLPSAVMLHGLGGNMLCFSPLAQMLNQFSEVVLIDLPGHGKSSKMFGNYAPQEILSTLTRAIEQVCGDSPIVLIGHSYGTTHALRLALDSSRLANQIRGVVCIAPPYATMLSNRDRTLLGYMPPWIFDVVFRSRDRVGGLYSPSVNRMVARGASVEARRDQLKINLMAPSQTVLKTVSVSSFFDARVEGAPKCPVLIISAKDDTVCPVRKAERLYADLKKIRVEAGDEDETNLQYIMVSNAGHAIIFEQPEIVAGLVSAFLKDKVDERLSMTWQLSYLASLDNKWSLKNEAKWKETQPVGAKLGPFKGMKVPREGDPVHGSITVEANHPEIRAIIDISREAPPYDPKKFERIEYFKFPTVSKIPPSEADVKAFIKLVKHILKQPWFTENLDGESVIGVHCHYGFNRTGFFICSYLIEQEHYTVANAVQAYKQSRPEGIRHQHFIDELYVRYNLRSNL